MRISFMVFTIFTLISGNAEAYIGPGLGAGAVGVALGILGSVVLALLAILYYPIKRLFKRKKNKGLVEQKSENASETAE